MALSSLTAFTGDTEQNGYFVRNCACGLAFRIFFKWIKHAVCTKTFAVLRKRWSCVCFQIELNKPLLASLDLLHTRVVTIVESGSWAWGEAKTGKCRLTFHAGRT